MLLKALMGLEGDAWIEFCLACLLVISVLGECTY